MADARNTTTPATDKVAIPTSDKLRSAMDAEMCDLSIGLRILDRELYDMLEDDLTRDRIEEMWWVATRTRAAADKVQAVIDGREG